MKTFAAAVMLVALYFLYRIAYPPKPAGIKKGDDVPVKHEIEESEVVGKSLFVRPSDRQSPTTTPISLNPEKQEEKANIFVPEDGITNIVIPSERLDEIFGENEEEDFNPDDLDIPPDENETDESDNPDADEEAEELRQVLEQDTNTELANGLSIEEMETATKAIDSPTDDDAEILYRVEKTDMFEQLVSGDEGKRLRIAAVIDRHIRSLNPETEVADNSDDNEYSDFNIAEYLK